MEQRLLQFIPNNLEQRIEVWGTKFVVGLLILMAFIIASMIVKKVICRIERRTDPQKEQLLTLIGDIARMTLITLGVITALGTMDINVSALVAGLGLTGFALGFAFRDALSNLLAGVMILMYHPFRRGDHIEVAGIGGGLAGEVTGIDLRYTTLQNNEKKFLIPNSILLTNAISVSHGAAPAPKPG